MPNPQSWLHPRQEGLFCAPGGFFIDPVRAVDRAIITHAHSDHARAGHATVLTRPETAALMRARLGKGRTSYQTLNWGEVLRLSEVNVWLQPAGHVLGSAQVAMEYRGQRIVVSGDYKRQPDRSCAAFEPIACDVFVTEATFGLPIFRMPDPNREISRLTNSLALFPERTHVVGCYSLGKTQRLICLLRDAGWEGPIHLHPALAPMCQIYQDFGIGLGDLRPIAGDLAGAVVLAPPNGANDRWDLADPVACLASGWMLSSKRARQSGAEIPMAISDHADWDGLLATIAETGAGEVWVTHGSEAALIHELARRGVTGRALRLIGYGDEG
jgi:putative mRNA 3-end processing factor